MPVEYLGAQAFAARVGLSVNTIRSYLAKGLLPEPDAAIVTASGELRGWLPETIDQWARSRPGQGARTDLAK